MKTHSGYYLFIHSFIWLISNKPGASILYLPPKPGCFICAYLHSSNPLFIKSNKHSSQFPFPISVSVSQSFNNIWKYMLAQKRGEHWGNRYFYNWNWDALFTACVFKDIAVYLNINLTQPYYPAAFTCIYFWHLVWILASCMHAGILFSPSEVECCIWKCSQKTELTV